VPTGEVSWVQDGQLRVRADDAEPMCLVDGVAGEHPVSWSSDAGRVLIDPTTAINSDGARGSGFDVSNTTVSLSAPTASATIAIDPATHRLMHHNLNGSTTDISFLDRTDEAAYYPSGKRIAAVGVGPGNAYGIWLSSNTGGPAKQILSVADPSTPVTNITWSADGSQLFFIHGFVHRLVITGLQLNEVGKADRGEANLVVSKVEDAAAWTTGPCDGAGTILLTTPLGEGDIRTMDGSPFAGSTAALQPVGFLSGYRLVFVSRARGCDGPGDVWVWSPVDGFHHVATDALAASVRIPRGAYHDIPDVILEQAPG
jgi:hypothetical protein